MATHLVVGQKAPSFTGSDQNGNKISLADLHGEKIVLYFYPQDDTPTCSVQACNLRDNYIELKKKRFTVIGISADSVESHQKFIKKYNLPFILIADPSHAIIEIYGVWGEKNLYGRKYMGLHRTTFIINEQGTIEKILKKPKSKVHTGEILK